MSLELNQLIELQELDLEIQRVADRLSMIPVERETREREFEQYAAEFLALKSKYEDNVANRKQLEEELAVTQQHHEKYQQDKMRVRNEKEYAAVLREIDATKKQIGVLETEVLKLMEEAEKLNSELTVLSPDVEKRRGEVDMILAELEREGEEAQKASVGLAARRQELAQAVPKPLFATYDRMSRTKRGQALAEVRDGICSACRMKVRPKLFSDVRKGDQMMTCESCGRILYYRPERSDSAEAATVKE